MFIYSSHAIQLYYSTVRDIPFLIRINHFSIVFNFYIYNIRILNLHVFIILFSTFSNKNMGFDDENLRPISRKAKPPGIIKLVEKHTTSGEEISFEVNYNGTQFRIKAFTYEELVKTLNETFHLSVNSSIYQIEVWSELYKEWLHMVSLPMNG